ncbi:MAG TPA: TonB-dependent receptor [Terriglobia bacterium]|nr:TonB-dependent receptor [Terriglobia bacterium]
MKLRTTLTFIVLLAASLHSFGQGFQGGLRGSVRDSGGAVVPGVEVTLTNEATNLSRTTITNDSGEYSFAALDPGSYRLNASLTGFKPIALTGIRVGTQQFVTLDLRLDVGAVAETVSVTAEVPLVETSNASQGTVLDTLSLQTLPAPGRNAFMIGVSVPTVIPSGDTQFNRQQDQTNASLLSLGGGTRRGNNYTLDGVPITDLRNRASANPTIEALEDVKVQVHTYDAEMGRTGGGVFNTTLKTGSNSFHGTGFFQTRPIWGEKNNFFSQKAGIPKPNNPYYLGGGGVGGPIIKNRTFFWFAAEDYHDIQTRNLSVIMPTAAERAGDFSSLTDVQGRPVIVYDPLTSRVVNGAVVRDPFPGNRIPANRINPVAAAMLKYMPMPDGNVDNGSTNYTRTALINNRFQQEYTVKIEHKFTDKVSVSGFYLYNRTDEPDADYFEPGLNGPNRFADPNDYLLKRRPQIVAVNSTSTLSSTSVLALRFGWTRFPDNDTMTANFDPATLGFSPAFLNQVSLKKFPTVRIRGYDQSTLGTAHTLGAASPTQINWKSISFNGNYSKFIGTHTFKVGADFRKIGLDTYIPGPGSGSFEFDKDFTSVNGGTGDVLSGNSVAAFVLGFPSGLSSRQSTLPISTPLNVYTHYYGAYSQDDWRVTSKLTLTYGLRAEHEDGLREQNNNFSVGFDPKASSSLSNVTIPADPVAGTPAHQVSGGLMYAGVGGNKTSQGNPPSLKWSPRAGVAYSFTPRTVLRGGYGLFWAPYNYPIPSTTNNNYGQVGYTQNTVAPQTSPIPAVTLDNPFPAGVVPPTGNTKGALSGVGTTISYVDQNRQAPRVHQYSLDVQRELPGDMAIKIGYVGSRSDHLGLGGSADTPVNINQVDPKYLSLGSALAQQITNPFLGRPELAGTSLGSSATLSRAQLLRPYPQFLDINARQVTEGRSRYNAAVIEWTKRLTHGWGGRFSYTYSVLKDNQVGETNFYSDVSPGLPLNNYNYIASMPRCAGGAQLTSACYDPYAEYGYGMLDVPHRVILAPIVELPFGKNRKWANASRAADGVIGGWSISAIVNLQSGFPLNIQQTDNTGLFSGAQRPNLSGQSLATSGNYEDRLASADHRTATWISAAGFTLAPSNAFGTAPRTITALRSPTQKNVDASFMKTFRLGESKTALVKVEMLNLFNRVTVRAGLNANTVGNANFGQITGQAGFMRITQIMFRYSF